MLRSSSICASFLYNYLMSESECNDKSQSLDKKCQKLRCLSDTLESYGGVLSKLSQMLSLNDQSNTIFSNCKPFSKDKTITYFKDFIDNLTIQLDSVDFNVYKSGSIGQVHKASYQNKNIVFKIQYVGLAEQTHTDLMMLDKITSYLYYFADMKHAMVDIKTKMHEELDYSLESDNQIKISNLYKHNNSIQIPKIIPELSTKTVLCMEFVQGRCLQEFIENANQDQKNKFGMCAVKFIFENIYKHDILYSDVHYGNFLAKEDSTLCVLDFGCIHDLKPTLTNNLRNLHTSIRHNDQTQFYTILHDMGIINHDISPKSKQYIYDYFKIQYTPWTSEEFEFTEEWLDMAVQKDTELMKEWTLPQDMVYFNRIPFGSYHIFTKLNLKGKFLEVFDQIFKDINII